MDEAMVLDYARRYLRAHTRGDLRFDEHVRPLKYVIGPDGRPAAPVMYAAIDAVDTVLNVPEDRHGAMEVQVTLDPFDEQGPAGAVADRWRIYHGDPPDIHWVFLDIDAARFEGCIIDGEALTQSNPLAADEPALCRVLNAMPRQKLRCLCHHAAGTDVERPVVVGVDSGGIDVRRAFDVVRIESARPMETADTAREVIERMIAAAEDTHRRDAENPEKRP